MPQTPGSVRCSPNKVHPCAFFSRRLNPAERNYPIGDREFLALKLALEEWRNLLEGSAVPFLVWTDHRNQEYLRTAKLLNPRQACWSLFFSHSPSPTALATKTSTRMPFLASTHLLSLLKSPPPSYRLRQ